MGTFFTQLSVFSSVWLLKIALLMYTWKAYQTITDAPSQLVDIERGNKRLPDSFLF